MISAHDMICALHWLMVNDINKDGSGTESEKKEPEMQEGLCFGAYLARDANTGQARQSRKLNVLA